MSGSRNFASSRWSAGGNEWRRSSARSAEARTWVATASSTANPTAQTSDRRSLLRTGIPGCNQMAARAQKLAPHRHPRMQPEGSQGAEAQDRGRNSNHQTRRQQSLLEGSQRLRQRQACDRPEHAGLSGKREIENPGADRERKRDDRGGRGTVRDGGREQRNRPDQQPIEQMPAEEVDRLRRRKMSAEQLPERQRGEGRNQRDKPGDRQCRHFRAN